MRALRITVIASILTAVTSLLSLVPAADALASSKFPAGDPMQEVIAFDYVIYYLPSPLGDPVKILNEEAHALDPKLKLGAKPPVGLPTASFVSMRLENDVSHKLAPPDLRALRYFGRGLSQDQAEKVQSSQQALVLTFVHPKAQVWEGLKVADVLAEKVARRTGGLVWDEEARLLYSPDEWRAKRIESWTTTPPDVSKHYAIHSYKTDTYVRAITLGMAKFGLPDIVVDQFSWSHDRSMGNLVISFAQAMAEGARFDASGNYELDLRAIHNTVAHELQLKSLKANATSIAHLVLLNGRSEDGDPHNRLVEIGFDKYPGADVRERQDALLSSLFGAQESIAHIRPTDELREASQKANAYLPTLQKIFKAGLAPGEFIELKLPFDVPGGGHEYMWVEVTQWSDDGKIQGLLRNEPEHVADLHAGEIVTVQQRDVFDYILNHANGTREGNETSHIIGKLQQH